MTKEEIKDTYSMRDIAVRYGFQATRSGFICCPFHQGDRQASLKLYEKDFHCHACGANGDIFTFVMMMDQCSFSAAFGILGGTYKEENPKVRQMRVAQVKRKQWDQERKRMEFLSWWGNRLSQVCRTLRQLDVLLGIYEPFSDEWCVAVEMKMLNQYRYTVLSTGTKEEQEGMRQLNE